MEDDQLLETALLENQGSFYFPDFISDQSSSRPSIINQNNSSSAQKIINILDDDSELSPVHSAIETSPRRSSRIRHTPQKYGTVA